MNLLSFYLLHILLLPVTIYTLICDKSCKSCTANTPTSCVSCNTTWNRIDQSNSSNTCPCSSKFYDNGISTCSSCQFQCQNCNQSASNCTTCLGDRQSPPLCSCISGYYDDQINLNCQTCNLKCQTCNSPSGNCSTCISQRQQNPPNCTCPIRTYDTSNLTCTNCHYSCYMCSGTSDTQCLQCSISDQRSLSGTTCLCLEGHYDVTNNSICSACHYSCRNCSGPNSNQCTSCGPYFTGRTNVTNMNTCPCSDGLFDRGSQNCSFCYYTCLTCNVTYTNCTSCDAMRNRNLNLLNNTCPCDSNYYDTKIPQCNPINCNYTCATCSGGTPASQSQTCLSCDGYLRKFDNVTSTCPCINGTYTLEGYSNCQSCNYYCAVCTSQQPSDCSRCADIRINLSNQCPCPNGYYDNYYPACKICQIQCLTCAYPLTQFAYNCTLCASNRISIPSCLCPPAYYDSYSTTNATCPNCSPQCATCTYSANNCLTCILNRNPAPQCNCPTHYRDIGLTQNCSECDYKCNNCATSDTDCSGCALNSHRISAPTCICSNGTFDQPNVSICQSCLYRCATCVTNFTNCLSCFASRNLNDIPNCSCPALYYDDGSSQLCQKCNHTCATCTNSTNCLSCFTSRNLNDLPNCSCPALYYDDGSSQLCQNCASVCATCNTNSTNCLTCMFNRNQADIPNCSCPDGYFDNQSPTCLKCSNQCLTCTSNSSNCLTCQLNNRNSTAPLCQCNDGYYDDGQNPDCQKCHYQCLTCVSQGDNCLTCDPTRYLPSCSCNSGTYDVNFTCSICNHQCLTCDNQSNNCSSCLGNRISLPLCSCPTNSYDNGNLDCTLCSPNCQTCEQSRENCLTCAPNRNNTPSCICLPSFYEDQTSLQCLGCSLRCVTCVSSSDNCLSCKPLRQTVPACQCNDGYYDDPSTTCSVCSYLCLTCVTTLDNCLTCNSTNKRQIQGTQCQCEDYYYNIDSIASCGQCHQSCQQCTGPLQTDCTKCNTSTDHRQLSVNNTCDCINSFYGNSTTKCQECNDSIKECQKPKCGDGKLMLPEECDDGNHISRDGCSQNCKVEKNYQCSNITLEKSVCINCGQQCSSCYLNELQIVQCSQCQDSNFLVDQTCLSCTANCKQCTGPLKQDCSQCLINYTNTTIVLKQCGVCEDQIGVYTRGLICVSKCGDGILRTEFKEQCDDGNTHSGDGCSDSCQIEKDYKCQVQNLQLSKCSAKTSVQATIVFTKNPGLYQASRNFKVQFESPLNVKIGEDITSQTTISFNQQFNYTLTVLQCNYSTSGQLISMNYNLTLNETIVETSLVINFLAFHEYKNDFGDVLINTTKIVMPPFEFISQDLESASQYTLSFGQIIIYFIGGVGATSLLTGGMEIFWNLLDTIQLFSYLVLINVQYPYNLVVFFKAFIFAQMPAYNYLMSIPLVLNIADYIIPSEQQNSRKDQLNNQGLSPVFLFNLISISVSWFGTYAIYLFSKFTLKIFQNVILDKQEYLTQSKLRKYLTLIKLRIFLLLQGAMTYYRNNFYYSIIIRTLISTSYDLDFALIAQQEQYNSCVQYPFLMMSALVSFSVAFIQFYFVCRGFQASQQPMVHLKSAQIKQSIGALFDGVNLENPKARNYNSILLVKRFAFMFFLVGLYDIPFLQILGLLTVLITTAAYIFLINPFEERIEYYKTFCCDSMSILFVILTLYLAMDDELQINDIPFKQLIGWIQIGLIIFTLLFQVIVDLYQQCKFLIKEYTMIRKLFEKLKGFLPNKNVYRINQINEVVRKPAFLIRTKFNIIESNDYSTHI